MPQATIYLPDDVAAELEEIRARRRPVPSMNAIIIEIIWEGLPSGAQVIIRRSRRHQSKKEDLRDD